MSWSSARAANSATDGRAGPIGARASPAPAGAPAGALGGVVPGRVVTSPRGATDPSGVVAVPARSGAGAAAGGGGATSAVTGLFAHPATIAAGTSIETASTRTRWFTMIPPGLRWLPLLLRVGERMVLHTTHSAGAPAPNAERAAAPASPGDARPRPEGRRSSAGDGRSRIGPRRAQYPARTRPGPARARAATPGGVARARAPGPRRTRRGTRPSRAGATRPEPRRIRPTIRTPSRPHSRMSAASPQRP